MKGIILAGGFGTRLRPCTLVTNKHLLPVYNKPMIFYPLQTLQRMGVKETMVVTGEEFSGHFSELLKDGGEFTMRMSYAVQKGAGGIADALKYTEDFADNGSIAVLLGDNIFEDDFTKAREAFDAQAKGARLFFKQVADPERFGVPCFDEHDRIVRIEEKPNLPKSSFAVTGLYLYDARVFDIIRALKPSGRGELEITDVNNAYIKEQTMTWSEVEGFWSDAGTFESLYHASTWARTRELRSKNQE